MNVSTERRVGVGIELRVSRATARELGLKSRVLGRRAVPWTTGKSLPVDLRLTRAASRALADVDHLRPRCGSRSCARMRRTGSLRFR